MPFDDPIQFKYANTVDLQVGDCITILRTLPANSFHSCLTSPPYFGLRDYGTARWDGGDADCDHRQDTAHQKQGATSVRAGRANTESQRNENFRAICGKCGARRIDHQIGLEQSPDEYVAQLVEVFREVHRVLRDDATLWLNLGDSYANDTKWGGSSSGKHAAALHGDTGIGRNKRHTGAKPKDLLGMPWRTALALQADGWWLRSAIVWEKGNCMPESTKTRPTSAYEMIFMLAKSATYYYDDEAIREPATNGASGNSQRSWGNNETAIRSEGTGAMETVRGIPWKGSATRNARNVWSINTKPFKEAHFATMAPEVARRCILAGCPFGGSVLDPFGGAGTTGLVAAELGRRATLIELNPAYAEIARKRLGHFVAG